MKTINDDPEGFFENGGWTFLDSGSDVRVHLVVVGMGTVWLSSVLLLAYQP